MKTKVLDLLNKRYSCKSMTGEKIPQKTLENILHSIQLTPTSNGFQAFKVLVIENEDVKKNLQPFCMSQQQITGCSHLLVFCRPNTVTNQEIDNMIKRLIDKKSFPLSQAEDYKTFLIKQFNNLTVEQKQVYCEKQIYIALGVCLLACVDSDVDSIPMEGFEPKEVDRLLNLSEKGLYSVVMCGIGYSNIKEDWNRGKPKATKEFCELFETI